MRTKELKMHKHTNSNRSSRSSNCRTKMQRSSNSISHSQRQRRRRRRCWITVIFLFATYFFSTRRFFPVCCPSVNVWRILLLLLLHRNECVLNAFSHLLCCSLRFHFFLQFLLYFCYFDLFFFFSSLVLFFMFVSSFLFSKSTRRFLCICTCVLLPFCYWRRWWGWSWCCYCWYYYRCFFSFHFDSIWLASWVIEWTSANLWENFRWKPFLNFFVWHKKCKFATA